MTESERIRLHAALACLVRAQAATWAAPAVGVAPEHERAAHWQAQALAWLLELLPETTRELALRPLGGRMAPIARRAQRLPLEATG